MDLLTQTQFVFVKLAVLVVTLVVIGRSLSFGLWKWYRRVKRRHIYVPVTAKVTNVSYSKWAKAQYATLSVEYEFAGKTISTRLTTSHFVGWEAEETKQMPLLADPQYPQYVEAAPSFVSEAEAHGRPRLAKTASRQMVEILVAFVAVFAFPLLTVFLWCLIPHGTQTHILVVLFVGWIIIFFSTIFLWTRHLFRLRNRSIEELASSDVEPLPELSADSLVCRFSGTYAGSKAVIVDFEAGQVVFHQCHMQRRFLEFTQAEFRCSFADLVAVHPDPDGLTIVTSTGKAVVPAFASRFEDLCARLPGRVAPEQTRVVVEHLWMRVVYFGGAIAVVVVGLAGSSLAPSLASPGMRAVFMLVGGVVFATLAHYGVVFVSRWLKRDISGPLAQGILVSFLGVVLLGPFMLPLAASWGHWALLVPLITGIAGFVVGCFMPFRIR